MWSENKNSLMGFPFEEETNCHYAVSLLPLLPMRAEPSEKAEMLSQLLFGERCFVKEQSQKWTKIHNANHSYDGWVDSKMITKISVTENDNLEKADFWQVKNVVASCFSEKLQQNMLLTFGSKFYNYDEKKEIAFFAGQVYKISKENLVRRNVDFSEKTLLEITSLFLNVPYLWGGKSALGIDCSGFTQLIFGAFGVQLPRDASQQVQVGQTVDFFSQAKTGDLAFFDNPEGKIVHVGILLDNKTIIHASGRVKIEDFYPQGIFSAEQNKYTHSLRLIKRII